MKFPPQEQEQPGKEHKMTPKPQAESPDYKACGKLKDKVAIITGGDSGIGKAVAIAFAKEGAHVVLAYLSEHKDAEDTQKQIIKHNQKCQLIPGDIKDEVFCQEIVDQAVKSFGRIDILVNNAAEQHAQDNFEDITTEQMENTFRTNIFSIFYLTKAALKHMKEGSVIINSASVTAYRGSHHLIDYSATKGAIVAFTRSLSKSLIKRGIRVNGVAPGPIWTPLIPASFEADHVTEFGKNTPIQRAGQPYEVAPSYVFLASEDSSYMSGQFLHPNGGEIING
jgi:NAD(P)-dependent dehydrogenase (short-subunit alcohol dehydrogenase family)